MAGSFLYVRPDESTLNASVAATVDSDYQAAWLADQRPGRPTRGTSTSLSATLTFASLQVGLVAIVQHNVTVNTAISAGVSGTISPAATQGNGIPLNAYVQVTPASITSFAAAVSGNSATVVMKVIGGKVRTLTNYGGGRGGPRYVDAQIVDDDYAAMPEGEFSSVPPYDKGLESRRLTGTGLYSTSQLADLRAWRQSQRSNTLPSLIVPDSAVNDVWLCLFRGLSYKPVASDMWEATLDFVEYPRSRW